MTNIKNEFKSLRFSAFDLRALVDWPDSVINDYTTTIGSLDALANQVAASTMIVDTGAPENVVTSNDSRQYFDSNTDKLYINPVVGAITGWVLIN